MSGTTANTPAQLYAPKLSEQTEDYAVQTFEALKEWQNEIVNKADTTRTRYLHFFLEFAIFRNYTKPTIATKNPRPDEP